MRRNEELREALRDMCGIIWPRAADVYWGCKNADESFARLCTAAMDAYWGRNMDCLAEDLSSMEFYGGMSALDVLIDPDGRAFMREYIADGWRSYNEYMNEMPGNE